jgi:ferrous iron transport protein A
MKKKPRTLNELKTGDKGVVSSLRGAGAVQQRLLEMGVCPGIEVEVVRFAPLGDPMMIHVRGFLLALRKSEASMVAMER